MKTITKLDMHHVTSIDHLLQPDEVNELTLESSALEIFTDFKKTRPLMIEENEAIIDAEQLMKRTHSSIRMVVNKDDEFVGVLTHSDITSDKVSERIHAHIEKEDILVKHIMTTRAEEMAISYQALQTSTIGDIVKTLQEHGQEHCLIIDEEPHLIRGVIYAKEIATCVHIPIHIDRRPTFLDLFRVLNH